MAKNKLCIQIETSYTLQPYTYSPLLHTLAYMQSSLYISLVNIVYYLSLTLLFKLQVINIHSSLILFLHPAHSKNLIFT